MRLLHRVRLTAALLVVVGGCATAPAAPGTGAAPGRPASALAAAIDSIIAAPPVHRATWGILLRDAASGEVLYSRNAEQLLIPASNVKLVVTAVALGRLGPDWRYGTEVRAARRSATHGATDTAETVVITGGGDPTWSTRFHDAAGAPFDSLAAIVARAGIRRVERLVIDVSRFADEPFHPTWEVGDLPGRFAPPVDAFAAGEGTFRLVVSGGAAAGTAGRAEVLPPLPQPLQAAVTTDTAGAPTRLQFDLRQRYDTVYLAATVAAGNADTLQYALTQPAQRAGEAVAAALATQGVTVGALLVVRATAEAARLRAAAEPLGVLRSPPLRDIVAAILQPSQNWISEQLVKTLGWELRGVGSWEAGTAVEAEYLAGVVGLDPSSFMLVDASGMSAQNLLTPASTVALLAHARAQPWGRSYREALARPGQPGSTLSSRLRHLEGRVFAKTGTITNVNSLSGHFVAPDGREVLFAILTNGSGVPGATMRAAIDGVLSALARHLEAAPEE